MYVVMTEQQRPITADYKFRISEASGIVWYLIMIRPNRINKITN